LPALEQIIEHEIRDGSHLKEESFLVFQRDTRTCDVLHALIRLSNGRDREASRVSGTSRILNGTGKVSWRMITWRYGRWLGRTIGEVRCHAPVLGTLKSRLSPNRKEKASIKPFGRACPRPCRSLSPSPMTVTRAVLPLPPLGASFFAGMGKTAEAAMQVRVPGTAMRLHKKMTP